MLAKVKAEPHTPPPVSDASAKKGPAVDSKPNAKAIKGKAGWEAQKEEPVGGEDLLEQSLTATPTMDNLVASA